jgi:hypothetical protein
MHPKKNNKKHIAFAYAKISQKKLLIKKKNLIHSNMTTYTQSQQTYCTRENRGKFYFQQYNSQISLDLTQLHPKKKRKKHLGVRKYREAKE